MTRKSLHYFLVLLFLGVYTPFLLTLDLHHNHDMIFHDGSKQIVEVGEDYTGPCPAETLALSLSQIVTVDLFFVEESVHLCQAVEHITLFHSIVTPTNRPPPSIV